MHKLLLPLILASGGGWLGWWLGSNLGTLVGFFAGMVGMGIGLYAGRRMTSYYLG
jgi:hypothetical protein